MTHRRGRVGRVREGLGAQPGRGNTSFSHSRRWDGVDSRVGQGTESRGELWNGGSFRRRGRKGHSHFPVVEGRKHFRKDEHPDWCKKQGEESLSKETMMWGEREEQRAWQTEVIMEHDEKGLGKGKDEKKFGGSCSGGWSPFGKSKLSTMGTGWSSALWDMLESSLDLTSLYIRIMQKQKARTIKKLWQNESDPEMNSCLQSVFTALDRTWCLHWVQSSGIGLPITSTSHPAMAWTFPLFTRKIEGLYFLLFKDQKSFVIQRKEKEKSTGFEWQIN